MKKPILYIALILVFAACQDVVQPEKPKNLIAKDEMVEILIETYLDNAARSIDYKTISASGIKMDSLIYREFNIDSLQFAKSNAFYAADVNIYMEIIQSVEKRLTTMQKKMDSIWEIERLQMKDANNKDETENPAAPVRDSLI